MSARAPKAKEVPPKKTDTLIVMGTLMNHVDQTLVILGIDRIVYRFTYPGGVYESWEPGLVVRAHYTKVETGSEVFAVEAA